MQGIWPVQEVFKLECSSCTISSCCIHSVLDWNHQLTDSYKADTILIDIPIFCTMFVFLCFWKKECSLEQVFIIFCYNPREDHNTNPHIPLNNALIPSTIKPKDCCDRIKHKVTMKRTFNDPYTIIPVTQTHLNIYKHMNNTEYEIISLQTINLRHIYTYISYGVWKKQEYYM